MDGEIQVIETPRGKVEFTVKGEGVPILIFHGSLENCDNSMGTDALLNSGFSIITPSRPGYGNTPESSGRTAEEAADLFNALLDSLNIKAVNLMAISYGGPTGLYFASKYPERVNKFVLASAVTKPIGDMNRIEDAKRFYGRGHSFMWGMLSFIGSVSKRSLAKKTYELFSTCNTAEIMKDIKKQDIESIMKFYRKKPENKGALVDLEHKITDGVLDEIKIPTLIVHSREDRAVSFDHAEYANSKIRGSELYVAETWGHFIFIGKKSEGVLKKIVDFLR